MAAARDWDPTAYARFEGLRLRPALDLLMRVGVLPEGGVVDLGCGAGAVGAALRTRFPQRPLGGVDTSPAMLGVAGATGAYDHLIEADAARWHPDAPTALIFSNAALHWLPDHPGLLRHLAQVLVSGGVLAVQMPRQYGAPSHRFLRDFAADMFPDRFTAAGWHPPVDEAPAYHRILAPLGATDIWETKYLHRLDPSPDGHPVRRFTESTAMRPYLEPLSGPERAAFVARYEDALASAYPLEADGSVLFPFRRIFMVLTRP